MLQRCHPRCWQLEGQACSTSSSLGPIDFLQLCLQTYREAARSALRQHWSGMRIPVSRWGQMNQAEEQREQKALQNSWVNTAPKREQEFLLLGLFPCPRTGTASSKSWGAWVRVSSSMSSSYPQVARFPPLEPALPA